MMFETPPQDDRTEQPLPTIAKGDFEQLSEFRHQMRRFQHFSESAARSEGITPLQHMLLLHIKGFPGREWACVGELAERLQARPNGVAALISRCEAIGLVGRVGSQLDHRLVEIHLLPAGEAILARLSRSHRTEIESLNGAFQVPRIGAVT